MSKRARDSGGGEDDGFDPMAFYREQQQAMLSEAAHHAEQRRDEISRAQQQGEDDMQGGGKRPRRSAATAASMSLRYMSDGDTAVDNRIFGAAKNVENMMQQDREDAADEQAGEDVVFQTPKAPAPRAKARGSPAAATGGRRGRPPGSTRGPGTNKPRGGRAGGGRGRPKRDWGGGAQGSLKFNGFEFVAITRIYRRCFQPLRSKIRQTKPAPCHCH